MGRNLVNNPQLTCNLQANPADKCTYIHGANIMPCPTGSSFDATRCGCLNADTRDCATRFDFAKNKLIDDSCRASFPPSLTPPPLFPPSLTNWECPSAT